MKPETLRLVLGIWELKLVMLGHNAFHFFFCGHGVYIAGLILVSEPSKETHRFIHQDNFGDILSLMGFYVSVVLTQHTDHIIKGGRLSFDFLFEGSPFTWIN